MTVQSNTTVTAFVAGLAVLSLSGIAEARPSSTAMTCAQAQSMITQNGAVVMNTGQYTFDRYVANLNFCQHGEVLRWDYVPTRDAPKCRVQRCVNPQPWRFD